MYCLRLVMGEYDSQQFLNIALSNDLEKLTPIEDEWGEIRATAIINLEKGINQANDFFEKYKVQDEWGEYENDEYVTMDNWFLEAGDAIEDSKIFICKIYQVGDGDE